MTTKRLFLLFILGAVLLLAGAVSPDILPMNTHVLADPGGIHGKPGG